MSAQRTVKVPVYPAIQRSSLFTSRRLVGTARCLTRLGDSRKVNPSAGQQKTRYPLLEAGFLDFTGLCRTTYWGERWDLNCFSNMLK